MYKVCLLSTLLVVSAQAYTSSYGGSSSRGQLIDVSQLADEMSLGSAGGSAPTGFGGGLSGGLSAGIADAGFAAEGIANGGAFITNLGAAPGLLAGGNPGSLAVLRKQNVDFVPVPSDNGPLEPTNVFVDSHQKPVNLIMRSISHGVNLEVKHVPSKGTYKQSESEDKPSRHVHTIRKPVIQEIREIITPIRKVIQEVRPVKEEIITNIPKAAAPVPVPVPVPALAAPAGPGGVAFVAGAGGLAGPAFGPGGALVGPVQLQGGFVPLKAFRGGCSNRGGCALAHKLAGPIVPSFGAAVGGAPLAVPFAAGAPAY